MMRGIWLSVTLMSLFGLQQPSSTRPAQEPQPPSARPAQRPPLPVPEPQPASAPVVPSCPEVAQAIMGAVRNDMRLRDWANLARYRDDNRKLAKPAGGEARVVFMGDSITDAWQQPRFGGFFPGKPYVDRGISGQTTPQMLVRFRPDVVDLGAKAVVILAGTNDIAGNTGLMTDDEIEGNFASMSELAHANGIKVVFSSILPVSSYHTALNGVPQTQARPMARIKTLNDWMRSYAGSHGDVYLDYFPPMIDASGLLRAELSADDLHPNAAGYAIMAPLAQTAIEKALGR